MGKFPLAKRNSMALLVLNSMRNLERHSAFLGLFFRIEDDAYKFKSALERISELVLFVILDKKALALADNDLFSSLVDHNSFSFFHFDHMLEVMVMERGVSSGKDLKISHDYIVGSVFGADENPFQNVLDAFFFEVIFANIGIFFYDQNSPP